MNDVRYTLAGTKSQVPLIGFLEWGKLRCKSFFIGFDDHTGRTQCKLNEWG